MKKGRVAKEGLIQYRIACQQVNVASLEEVIKHFLKLATDRAEAAQAAASGGADVGVVVEDLEADTSPEDLMLAYVSAENRGARADRELVTPWFKFLWEAYRTVLEILRNNSKLESLYAMTAHRAFGFCATYKRTTEFRRLCEILRNHLANLNKYRDARDRPDLTQADSLALYLETRFEQLKTAAELNLWQEAFRSVEDIHGLMSTVKQKPKPAMMAVYYAKLARVFAVSEGCAVYHAYALWKLYGLSRSFNKNLTPADVRQLASGVLLAALAVPPYDGRAGAAHAELEADKERNLRMATLLGFTLDPKRDTREVLSRSALLAELAAKGLLQLVHPEVRSLHSLLEAEFHPLDLCARVGTALDALRALPSALSAAAPLTDLPLAEYARRLEVLASLRALQQVGAVYASMRLDALAALIPFQPFADTEKLIVDAVKYNFLSLRLDHRAGCVHFGAPRLEADLVRSQISALAQRLSTAAGMLAAIGAAPAPAPAAKPDVARVLAAVDAAHRAALKRKVAIEKRKEEAEQRLMEHEREEEARKLATQRAAEEAERKRLEEERRSREEERIRADIEEKELEEARVLLLEAERRAKEKASKKAGAPGAKPGAKPAAALGVVPGAAPLPGAAGEGAEAKLDKRQLMEDALAEQIRERQELEKKLARLARTMDHLERAKREEERPLLETFYKAAAEQDAVYAAEQTAAAAASHKAAWEADLAEKARLGSASADKATFTAGVSSRRAEAAAAAAAERAAQLAELKAQRAAEAESARKRELLKRLKEADAQRRRAAEEASRAERAASEQARRAEEEAERLAKLDELAAARQRERDNAPPSAGGGAAQRDERWGGSGAPRRDEAPPRAGGADRWGGPGGAGASQGGPPPERWAPRGGAGGDDRGGSGGAYQPRRDGPPPGGADRWGGGPGGGSSGAAPPRRDERPPGGAPASGGRFDSGGAKWGK